MAAILCVRLRHAVAAPHAATASSCLPMCPANVCVKRVAELRFLPLHQIY